MSPRAEAISEPPPAAAVETKDAKQEEVRGCAVTPRA
jgi:hypothetical protein